MSAVICSVYFSYTVAELRDMAKAKSIRGWYKMNKAELVIALEDWYQANKDRLLAAASKLSS